MVIERVRVFGKEVQSALQSSRGVRKHRIETAPAGGEHGEQESHVRGFAKMII